MQTLETQQSDRLELAKGAVPSFLINLGFLLIAKGDQRMILLLLASTIVGIVLLLTPRGALGMGILLGAIASVVVGIVLAASLDWSPLDSNDDNGPPAPVPSQMK